MTNKDNDKIDKIVEDIHEIKLSQARTEIIMDEHIRRTALNEENIKLLREEFKPVKHHVQFINSVSIFIVGLGGLLIFLNEVGVLKRITDLLFP